MTLIHINQQPIELYKIFKLSGLASGGEAKMWIADGAVLLNGEVETRKRKKVVDGDVVNFQGHEFKVSFSQGDAG